MIGDDQTCKLCGMHPDEFATCERGDCPIERAAAPSVYPYPRFGKDTADAEIRETSTEDDDRRLQSGES